ncbi:unnamed protein product [Peronospora belbahrii]|uniref:Peroxisomal membrane protein PEX14 n=1 Tax=Peronospora belbahrii TaxID=622444 RepID=A0ABN8D4F6_9STRA|nr:unnamed protein product [Peronospora belbahrii]
MREDQVVSGLKFLQHPSVQSTPISERMTFLEGKGMTKEEIQEAIERYHNGKKEESSTDQATLQTQQQQPYNPTMMMTPSTSMPPMMHHRARYPPAYVRVLYTVSSLVGAASILTFIWNYAVQLGYIPWLRPMPSLIEAAKAQEEKEKEDKKDEALLAELSGISAAIEKQTKELAKLSSSLDAKEREWQNKTMLSAQISSSIAEQGNAQSIAELKAEISTLKALLLAKKTLGGSDSDSIDTGKNGGDGKTVSVLTTEKKTLSTATDTHPAVVSQVMSTAERMQKALKMLRTENSLEQLKLAAGILSMYVKNLIENPDVPRYRRIATGNANFKQKIEPLKHHEELLKSIGFETSGLNMEWKWHTASKTTGAYDENIAILRAVLKALQSLSSPNACSNLSLEEIAHASLDEYFSQQDKKNAQVLMTTIKTCSTVSSTQEMPVTAQSHNSVLNGDNALSNSTSTSLDAFMARLEQQTSVGNVTNMDVSETKAVSSFSANNASDEEGEKMLRSAISSISPSVTMTQPSYPESFKEVMDLIQKGETVPVNVIKIIIVKLCKKLFVTNCNDFAKGLMAEVSRNIAAYVTSKRCAIEKVSRKNACRLDPYPPPGEMAVSSP